MLGHDSAAAINSQRPFKDLGFDSVAAVELRNSGSPPPPGSRPTATTAFDYDLDRASLIQLLELALAAGPSKGVAVRAQATDEPIAIVGMACRFAGEADLPSGWGWWRMAAMASPSSPTIAAGTSGASSTPTSRPAAIASPATPAKPASCTIPAKSGPAEFFGISPREALSMESRTGVAAPGSSWKLWRTPCWTTRGRWPQPDQPAPRRRHLPGLWERAGLPGQHGLGPHRLHPRAPGPTMAVHTACSSSCLGLAIHLASQALRQRRALAGAGRRCDRDGPPPSSSRGTPPARALAPDGRCRRSFAGEPWAPAGRGRRRAAPSSACRTREGTATHPGPPRWSRPASEPPRTAHPRSHRAQRSVARASDPRRRWRTPAATTTSTWSRRMAPELTLGDPIEARRSCSPPTVTVTRRSGRCGSARSSRTSATPRQRLAWAA